MFKSLLIRCSKRDRCCQAGFSLIELAIVMVIVSLLALPLLQQFRIYLEEKHNANTTITLNAINAAISDFYDMNGRYPCPSDRAIGFGETGHGEERCTEILALSSGDCSADNGACRVTQGGAFVDIGGVPYTALGISYENTLDGWNHALTYAVTESLTDAATFDPAEGRVQINDENGNDLGVMHAILISHGEDSVGAFNLSGDGRDCDLSLVIESENCDVDGVFISSLRNEAQGANYYDDIVSPSNFAQSGIWTYSPPDPLDPTAKHINSLNQGNVGIGTITPSEKLDVVGNIKAEDVHGLRFCDESGTICFSADFIGGTGDACPTGQVMTGIANNQVQCRSVSVTPTTGTCPAGQYVYEISGGQVHCRAP